MQILKTIVECVAWKKNQFSTIGFVPTMGALHDGHLSLIKQSKQLCSKTIVSIFVNPAQFSQNEDFDSYPKTLEEDLKHLETLCVDAVFLPLTEDMYPDDKIDFEYKNDLFSKLEGFSRPHFFFGVTKIVAMLFRIVGPTHTFFGEKDAQQLLIVRKMIIDLNFKIKLVSCPTCRDKNGLALSSRNNYLSKQNQKDASLLYKSLLIIKDEIEGGEKNIKTLKSLFINSLKLNLNFKLDYISIAHSETLCELDCAKGHMLISAAAYFNKIRLIDNISYQSST